jgi:hypothetical protein
MAEYTVTINLPDHKRGDKWPGIASIGPVLINAAQPAATLARIRMHFKHTGGSVNRLDTDATLRDAPITIGNATTWAASIPPVMAFLPTAGDWAWDMEFYATGESAPLTLYQGTLTVHEDDTR